MIASHPDYLNHRGHADHDPALGPDWKAFHPESHPIPDMDTLKEIARTLKAEGKAWTIYRDWFDGKGTPRSMAYKAGVLSKLAVLSGELPTLSENPYKVGTAEADAFYCGRLGAKVIFESWELHHSDRAISGLGKAGA